MSVASVTKTYGCHLPVRCLIINSADDNRPMGEKEGECLISASNQRNDRPIDCRNTLPDEAAKLAFLLVIYKSHVAGRGRDVELGGGVFTGAGVRGGAVVCAPRAEEAGRTRPRHVRSTPVLAVIPCGRKQPLHLQAIHLYDYIRVVLVPVKYFLLHFFLNYRLFFAMEFKQKKKIQLFIPFFPNYEFTYYNIVLVWKHSITGHLRLPSMR